MGKTVPQPKQLPVFISQLFLINVDQEVVKPLWEGIYTESSGIFMKLVMLPRITTILNLKRPLNLP